MQQIEKLSKHDLAITGIRDGKMGCQMVVTVKGYMPVLDYDKVLNKLNELIDIVNMLYAYVEQNER